MDDPFLGYCKLFQWGCHFLGTPLKWLVFLLASVLTIQKKVPTPKIRTDPNMWYDNYVFSRGPKVECEILHIGAVSGRGVKGGMEIRGIAIQAFVVA